MKSIVSSSVLGAFVLSQAVSAASVHSHFHRRAAAASPAASVERRSPAKFMSVEDYDSTISKGVKIGKNVASSDGGPVTVGGEGPFFVEFDNQSGEDIVVVTWSGTGGQWGAVTASFVGAQQPDVTHSLLANTTTVVSFDPSKADGNSISGGWGAIYPSDGSALTSFSGQLNNVWGEYTFTTLNEFSTTDVSRLVNMKGRPMEIHNYANKEDADNNEIEPRCSSTMDKCSFVCTDGSDHCMVGKIQNCPVGTAYTTSNANAMDGGCSGLSSKGGYVQVKFY